MYEMQPYAIFQQNNVHRVSRLYLSTQGGTPASKSLSLHALLTHMPKPIVPQFCQSVILSDSQHIIAYSLVLVA
jgi:hypothetical protein